MYPTYPKILYVGTPKCVGLPRFRVLLGGPTPPTVGLCHVYGHGNNENTKLFWSIRIDKVGMINNSTPFNVISYTHKVMRREINNSDGRVVWSVCLLSCRLGFDSESGQTNDFKIGIHSFPA